MKNYQPNENGKNIYTIEVFLQDGEYKYSFTYEIRSHGVGGVLDSGTGGTLQGYLFNHLGYSDEEIDDMGSIEFELTNPETGEKLIREIDVAHEDEFEEILVGVMIVDCKPQPLEHDE